MVLQIRWLFTEKRMETTMHVTLVHVWVKPQHIDDFIRACKDNHLASIREEGNMRFDILQSPTHNNQFILYEAYANAASAAAHKDSQHYLDWREEVAEWMEKPRQGQPMNGLFPTGSPNWSDPDD
jgi:autoinducer 2-degrading protein